MSYIKFIDRLLVVNYSMGDLAKAAAAGTEPASADAPWTLNITGYRSIIAQPKMQRFIGIGVLI